MTHLCLPRVRVSFVVLAVVAGLGGGNARPRAAQAPFDVIVRGGTVVDGTGAAGRVADVGIRGGRIAAVGELPGATAVTTIDAVGQIVAPGFIDVHTHADDLAEHPAAEHFARMGVTTVVAGNCGGSPVDVGAAFAAIRSTGAAINFASFVGHNSVRAAVMGTARRAPTPAELARMEGLVAAAMEDGAVGFSTGLQYVPGTYADQDEIVALAKVAARSGGVYASHMRNEGTEIEAAVAEALAIGEQAHIAVQVSHLKIDAPSRWGASAKALAMIDAARARGMVVLADQYLYDAASSNLGIRFPSWALEGGQPAIVKRLDDAATWATIKAEMGKLIRERGIENYSFARIANYPADPALNGLTIPEVAQQLKGGRDLDAQFETMRLMLRAGGASMVYQFMAEDDITRILKHPMVAIASDSSLNVMGQGVPHPRGYGNAVRALGRYVREMHVISLEEAVRKMTSLPANQFGFADRGRIAPGTAADLVIFDAETVADTATYDRPHQYPVGIGAVLVNGVPVVIKGAQTSARPGLVLTRATH
ncbi:MAG TPA: D-aminoacylase [Vicinamibacterales bacterium]|nr:D-aminoacylase [Vicinamibacterales bacterium]